MTTATHPPYLSLPISRAWGGAFDPLATSLEWSAWRLTGLAPRSTATELLLADARSTFRFVVEQLWMPGQTALLVQVEFDPARSETHVSLMIGVSAAGTCSDELDQTARVVESQLARPGLPWRLERTDPSTVLHVAERMSSSATIRQRQLDVDDGRGGEVPVVARWNPTSDPWSSVIRLLGSQPHWHCVRASAIATQMGVADRSALHRASTSAERMVRELTERPELMVMAERCVATIADVAASFATPVLCGEVALLSDQPVSERFARSIASCFTSETDVVRRSGYTVVAGQRMLLGGFEIERDPPHHREALALGLPVRGSLVERHLTDLWTLTEAPLSWPMVGGGELPGIAPTVGVDRVPPAELTATTDGAAIGRASRGDLVRVPRELRARHIAIAGRPGSGKSALMLALTAQNARTSEPFLWIDPHGSASLHARRLALASGMDPIVFDVRDASSARLKVLHRLRADGSNVDAVEHAIRLLVGFVVSHLPPEYSGPRFSEGATARLWPACTNGLEVGETLTLLGDPAQTRDLVDDERLPTWVVQHLLGQFSSTHSDAASVREWVNSKFAPIWSGPARKLIAAPGEGVDIGAAILAGRPVIVSLAGLPEADGQLFGHLALSLAVDAVVARGEVALDSQQIHFYVDEAPRFPAHNLELLLTGGRKFGAALTLACQSAHQYVGSLADIALGAETQVAFAQTPRSADWLAPVLDVEAKDLLAQPDFHAHVRVGRGESFQVRTPTYDDLERGWPSGSEG